MALGGWGELERCIGLGYGSLDMRISDGHELDGTAILVIDWFSLPYFWYEKMLLNSRCQGSWKQ